MLKITVQNLRDVMIVHCIGRLSFEGKDILLATVSKQSRLRTVVLDLAGVTAIDAAGIGMLVSLRTWSRRTGTALKLMNLTPRVENLLEILSLRSVFEIYSVPEMLCLLYRPFDRVEWAEAGVESPGTILDAQPNFVQG
jgi:anti-anti-sigma factor